MPYASAYVVDRKMGEYAAYFTGSNIPFVRIFVTLYLVPSLANAWNEDIGK
jgi:hypothetical protein